MKPRADRLAITADALACGLGSPEDPLSASQVRRRVAAGVLPAGSNTRPPVWRLADLVLWLGRADLAAVLAAHAKAEGGPLGASERWALAGEAAAAAFALAVEDDRADTPEPPPVEALRAIWAACRVAPAEVCPQKLFAHSMRAYAGRKIDSAIRGLVARAGTSRAAS